MKTEPSAEAQPNMVGDWCICVSGAKLDLFWPAELVAPRNKSSLFRTSVFPYSGASIPETGENRAQRGGPAKYGRRLVKTEPSAEAQSNTRTGPSAEDPLSMI